MMIQVGLQPSEVQGRQPFEDSIMLLAVELASNFSGDAQGLLEEQYAIVCFSSLETSLMRLDLGNKLIDIVFLGWPE